MKAKLLLLLCCLFAIEGWAGSNEIRLKRLDAEPNPMGIPVFPPAEKCVILTNVLNISFDRIEDYATITVMNKKTGEIVHSKTYPNTKDIMVNMSACDKGEYSIYVILPDRLLEGTFTVQ
jgi:hypothetical protein